MPSIIIDACCLFDLLASGHSEAILRACGYAWHLPVAVVPDTNGTAACGVWTCAGSAAVESS